MAAGWGRHNFNNSHKTFDLYDVAKRQFAFEFGIDTYTDYDPVVDRLGENALTYQTTEK